MALPQRIGDQMSASVSLRFAVLAAGLAGAAGFGVVLAAPEPATATTTPGLLTIASPADQGLIIHNASGSAALRINLQRGGRLTKATLNGRAITGRFARDGEQLVARVAARQGLRRGTNVLTVRATRSGRRGFDSHQFTYAHVAGRALGEVRAPSRVAGGPATVTVGGLGRGERIYAFWSDRARSRNLSALFDPNAAQRRSNAEGERRTAVLDASHGLRRGTNTLVVRIYSARRGLVTTITRRITMGSGRPVPGVDVEPATVAGGQSVGLDATPTLPAAGGTKSRLVFRWSIVGKPKGSQATLSDARSAQPVLKTDHPGRHRIRVRIAQPGGATATMTTTVDATADPLVAVNTGATGAGGTPGVLVEVNRHCNDVQNAPTCFYPVLSNVTGAIQLLVLDRATLEPVSFNRGDGTTVVGNAAYSAQAGTLTLDQLNTALLDLASNTATKNEVLAIVVQRDGTTSGLSQAQAGLEAIGAGGVPSAVPYSFIGIPGMVKGKAAANVGTSIGGGAAGALKGYLRQAALVTSGGLNQADDRIFDFGDAVPYSAVPAATPADQANAGIVVGSTTLPASGAALIPGNGDRSKGGFQVVVFDPNTLKVTANNWYAPFAGQFDGETCINWNDINSLIHQAVDSGSGVIITSLGGVGSVLTEGCGQGNGYRGTLIGLEVLGVNPDILARTVSKLAASPISGATYSMAATRGLGYDASSIFADYAGDSTIPTAAGNLSGDLQRQPNGGLFYPASGDPSGLQTPELQQILFRDNVDWPLTPAPGAASTAQQIAFAYLAQQTQEIASTTTLWQASKPSSGTTHQVTTPGGSTVWVLDDNVRQVALDLRSEYPSLNYSFTNPFTVPSATADDPFTQTDLGAAGVPTCPGNASEIDDASEQLACELDYRGTSTSGVIGLFATIQKPITQNQAAELVNLKSVASTVVNDTLGSEATLRPNASKWGGDTIRDAAVGLKVASAVFKTIASTQPELKVAFNLLSLGASSGGFGLLGLEPPPGQQAADIANYLLLEQQLDADAVSVTTQVADGVQQWQDSTAIAQEVALSDWGKMQAIRDNTVGNNAPWVFTESDIDFMTNAFLMTTRQEAYYDYWPLLYRWGVAGLSEFFGDMAQPPTSASGASSWNCNLEVLDDKNTGGFEQPGVYTFMSNGGLSDPSGGFANGSTASLGTGGIGDGQMYTPLFLSGGPTGAPNLYVYMTELGWTGSPATSGYLEAGKSNDKVKGTGYGKLVSASLMTTLTQQPADVTTTTDASGGFYPPSFWFASQSGQQLNCALGKGTGAGGVGFEDGSLYTPF